MAEIESSHSRVGWQLSPTLRRFPSLSASLIPAIANRPPIEHIAIMQVSIIFDAAFRSYAAGAVWIVDTAENRRWFDKQVDLDARSAVFNLEGGMVGREAILRSIWNVQEHYTDWSQIFVIGVPTNIELSDDLRDEGKVIATKQGFALARV
ncbi:hypothetical protein ACQR50_07220 [Sphingomonas sp. Xoc002]|uniref:hypothetical protein n=1 Tax=Sphingomonas sp. Xoc002 TaxID=2837624 RepID=UPI003D16EAB1